MKTTTPSSAVGELNSCIRGEIASIGALDVAILAEKDAGYVVLFREAKSSKQAAVEQLSALTRMLGGSPAESAVVLEAIQKIETLGAATSRSLTLQALRAGEKTLIEEYTRLRDELTDGLEKRVLTEVLRRAVKRWHVLAAHLARAGGDHDQDPGRLPRGLEEYFATSEDRVCMRCLFDRPGSRRPLVRSSPHPQTYVCAACHDETLAGFPEDMQPLLPRLPEARREALVMERALGKPEVVRADKTIVAILSGLVPEPSAPPKDFPEERPQERQWAVEPGDADVRLSGTGTPLERDYVEVLFDFQSVSRTW